MSIPKAAGIETEYGIIVLGDAAHSPFAAAQLLLNAYQSIGGPAIPMGMYYNTPAGSAQATADKAAADTHGDSSLEGSPDVIDDVDEFEEVEESENGVQETAPQPAPSQAVVYYGLGSLMLANGARFYIDHTHPEYCTPETLSPRRMVAADKAGEHLVARCMEAANQSGALPEGQQLLIYKNNSDQKGNSYGCHENYLLDVDLFEDLLRRRSHMIYRYLLPFQISRVVICGAGKVGCENHTRPAAYQLSQRADFFEMLTGMQTTYRRPLFNLRDESHAENNTFRRLHVILGDANMSEIATYLKVGTMQLVLHMIEDGFIKDDLTLAQPIDAFRQVSRDLTFRQPLELESGTRMTAVEIQERYLTLAEQYLEDHDGTDEQWDVWEQWAGVIDAIQQNDQAYLSTRLDWAIKKTVLDRYLNAQQATWDEATAWQPVIETVLKVSTADDQALARAMAQHAGLPPDDYTRQREIFFGLRRLDLEYHDVRYTGPHAGLFYRLQERGVIERLLTDTEIDQAIQSPPPDTRAWLRGKSVEKFAAYVVGIDWGYVKLRHPDPRANLVYRLEFPDPLVGTEADLGRVWDRLRTPEEMFNYFSRNGG